MSKKSAKACDQSPEQQVRALYTNLALNRHKDFGWAKGKDNARALGYDPAWLARLPEMVWESAAAVGNPFTIGFIESGETVVDLLSPGFRRTAAGLLERISPRRGLAARRAPGRPRGRAASLGLSASIVDPYRSVPLS